MRIKRFILRVRLFLITLFRRHPAPTEEKGFIYEFDDDDFKKLPMEEKAKHVQRSWNRHIQK